MFCGFIFFPFPCFIGLLFVYFRYGLAIKVNWAYASGQREDTSGECSSHVELIILFCSSLGSMAAVDCKIFLVIFVIFFRALPCFCWWSWLRGHWFNAFQSFSSLSQLLVCSFDLSMLILFDALKTYSDDLPFNCSLKFLIFVLYGQQRCTCHVG